MISRDDAKKLSAILNDLGIMTSIAERRAVLTLPLHADARLAAETFDNLIEAAKKAVDRYVDQKADLLKEDEKDMWRRIREAYPDQEWTSKTDLAINMKQGTITVYRSEVDTNDD